MHLTEGWHPWKDENCRRKHTESLTQVFRKWATLLTIYLLRAGRLAKTFLLTHLRQNKIWAPLQSNNAVCWGLPENINIIVSAHWNIIKNIQAHLSLSMGICSQWSCFFQQQLNNSRKCINTKLRIVFLKGIWGWREHAKTTVAVAFK